jgi:hypothetical protein
MSPRCARQELGRGGDRALERPEARLCGLIDRVSGGVDRSLRRVHDARADVLRGLRHVGGGMRDERSDALRRFGDAMTDV